MHIQSTSPKEGARGPSSWPRAGRGPVNRRPPNLGLWPGVPGHGAGGLRPRLGRARV